MYRDEENVRKRKVTFILVLVFLGVVIVGIGINYLFNYHRTDAKKQAEYFNDNNRPTLIMFYSKTCPDCKSVVGTVQRNDYQGKLLDNVLNTSQNSRAHNTMYLEWQNKQDKRYFAKYGVNSVPTFMIIYRGQPQPIYHSKGLPVYQYSGTNKKVIRLLYTRLQLPDQP